MILKRVALLILSGLALAQVQVSFEADSLHGTLGDIIEFEWKIEHGDELSFSLPDVDTEGTGIEIIDQSLTPEKEGTRLNFRTAVYDSVGIYQFPLVQVVALADEGEDTLNLPGPQLHILSVLTPADTSFRDIKGLHSVRMALKWWLILLLLAVISAGFLAFYLYKHFKARQEVDSGPTIIPPEEAHIVAFKALDQLNRSSYLQGQNYKSYYSELSYILKQYYENRYLMDALESTTSELMEKMETMLEFDGNIRSKTAGILNTADMIKFAKATSSSKESKKYFQSVEQIVDTTKIEMEIESGSDT